MLSKTALWRLGRVFTGVDESADVLRARHKAFSRLLPQMYGMLLVNMWSLAWTHVDHAPDLLTIAVPSAFTMLCLARVFFWLRAGGSVPSDDRISGEIRRTNFLAVGMASAFVAWSLALYSYGDVEMQVHVAFFMAFTVVVCIFCLMFLRPAAFVVAGIVNLSFIGFFGATGDPVFVAMSINVLLVSVTLLFVINAGYRNFVSLVRSEKQAEVLNETNFRLANIDSLTELPNRRHFFSHLKERMEASAADGGHMALVVMDLDNFKPVNDLYGHSTGDALLREAAQRMARAVGDDAFVARLGGDEFALIIAGSPDEVELLALSQRVIDALSRPFRLERTELSISASAGIALYPHSDAGQASLFDRADYALYDAKRQKWGSTVIFSAAHEYDMRADAEVERALKSGSAAGNLSVVYQPIVEAKSGRVVAFEALARWNSEIFGTIPPAQFVHVAEKAGQVNELTRILLGTALEQLRRWPVDVRLSFNLSVLDISSPNAVSHIADQMKQSGVDPHRIDFEITETAFIEDEEQVRGTIETLRALGAGISLDDFGTGYSSLARLHGLPLTKIKIDRSFVSGLRPNTSAFKIIRSLLGLAKDMDLECIVEGVETARELSVLRGLNCQFLQGYYYSEPISANAAFDLVSRRQAVA